MKMALFEALDSQRFIICKILVTPSQKLSSFETMKIPRLFIDSFTEVTVKCLI